MLSEAHTSLRQQRSARDLLFVPRFRNTIKGICDVVCRAGTGDGAYLVLLPVVAEAGREQVFAHNVCGDLLPELAALRGIDTAVFARRNAEVTRASSTGDDRAGDRYVDGLLAIEAGSETGVAAAIALLSAQNLARMGGNAHLVAAPCALRLMYTLEAPPTTVAGGGDKAA